MPHLTQPSLPYPSWRLNGKPCEVRHEYHQGHGPPDLITPTGPPGLIIPTGPPGLITPAGPPGLITPTCLRAALLGVKATTLSSGSLYASFRKCLSSSNMLIEWAARMTATALQGGPGGAAGEGEPEGAACEGGPEGAACEGGLEGGPEGAGRNSLGAYVHLGAYDISIQVWQWHYGS